MTVKEHITIHPRAYPGSRSRLGFYLLFFASIFYYLAQSRSLTSFFNFEYERPQRPLIGKAAESAFLSIPDEKSAISASRLYATKPHMAGTPGDLMTALEFLRLLQTELGIASPSPDPIYSAGSSESQHATLSVSHTEKPRAWIDTYYPVMNTPLNRHIQILNDNEEVDIELDLTEKAGQEDHEAGKYSDAVPTFHGLSRGGDVTGTLFNGGYCTKEEFDQFQDQDFSLNGTIVLCRYGGIFRGLKVKGAQDHGAIGVLIYSDINDDGTVTEMNGYKAYPLGPARNPTSVQRGSVQFLSVYPGDPTTPGYPSYENATRTEGSNIPAIPSLPISWANAQTLLATLSPDHTLKGKRVRFINNVDTRIIPVWNVMGVIPGHIKGEVVVVGNHRDAWVMGATDPSSGTVSVHEVIKGIGHLLRNGWKPLRTILIASWDAEEYGLIGSTEWGEDFPQWINEHVVTYLNLDSSVSGSRLRASGSPLLAHFIRQTAREIPHPTDKNRTLWDATNDDGKLFGLRGDDAIDKKSLAIHEMEFAAADNVGVSPLGSGSDYTVFLQRAGVPSTNGGFGATTHDPVYHYHSIFDSERWQEFYGDPGFFRHVAIAKHLGLQTLRLSGSIVLPFNTSHYSYELESYLDRVEILASQASLDVQFSALRNSIHILQNASFALDAEKDNSQAELKHILEKWRKKHRKGRTIHKKLKRFICRIKRVLKQSCGPQGRHKDPAEAAGQPRENNIASYFAGHVRELPEQQHEDLTDREYNGIAIHAGYLGCYKSWAKDPSRHPKIPIKKLKQVIRRIQAVNKKLIAFERGFISEEGIKDREWFKHLGMAPGKWLGYGATTLPALTESITFEKNVTLAKYEAERLKALIDKLAVVISLN